MKTITPWYCNVKGKAIKLAIKQKMNKARQQFVKGNYDGRNKLFTVNSNP